MKNLITLIFLCGSLTAFSQVNPSSGTQGALTGGATVTKNKVTKLASVSMQDISRFHGSYSNGNVDAQGDRIHLLVEDNLAGGLDFTGTVVTASTSILELDGVDQISSKKMQIQVTVAPPNKSNPRELYVIKQFGSSNKWVLKEDPFNPKDN